MTPKTIPTADRPNFPDGYSAPDGPSEILPWSYIQERMAQARNYWIATATPQGKPAATPVWGVWLDDILYFDGSPQTRRGRNIAANPQVAVHLESGDQALMLEGEAHILPGAPDKALAKRVAAAYRAKYAADGYAPTAKQWDQGGLHIFEPRKVVAWTNFLKDPTRFKIR